MATNYNNKIVTDGLVLCLDAGDRKSYSGSGSTWTDRSGNGNNATLVNSPTHNEKSFTLDGVDDRMTFDTPFADESNLTVIMWFKGQAVSGTPNGFGYLLHNNDVDNSTGNSYITIGENGQNNQYYAALNGRFTSMSTGITTDTTTVHQIALTWDGATQRVYFDGVLKESEALTSNSKALNSTTSIGDYHASAYREWDGEIYSCLICDQAHTADQIADNYYNFKNKYS